MEYANNESFVQVARDASTPDLTVFIGRFRPFHNGHLAVVREALKRSLYLTILVGSTDEARSIRNPFTFAEVTDMINGSLTVAERKRVLIQSLPNVTYNDDLWLQSVQHKVALAAHAIPNPSFGLRDRVNVSLIGHSKDRSSYYIKLFPQWGAINVPSCAEGLSATELRDFLFAKPKKEVLHWLADGSSRHFLPDYVRGWLTSFVNSGAYPALVKEFDYVRRYKEAYAVADDVDFDVLTQHLPGLADYSPGQLKGVILKAVSAKPKFAPIFVTVDAVVVQSGHVLMIQRGDFPGKGLWALPGGYVEADEKIDDAWVRELNEETSIKVPEKVLRGSVVATEVFDDPNRDPRGRMITHARLVQLDPGAFPKVRGGDDAKKAKWVPFAEIKQDECYADHYQIIQTMKGRLKNKTI